MSAVGSPMPLPPQPCVIMPPMPLMWPYLVFHIMLGPYSGQTAPVYGSINSSKALISVDFSATWA